MSNNNNEMRPATKIDFGRNNDLKKLLKQLEKLTPDAIAAITDVMTNPEADLKLKADMAKTILQLRITTSESICKDQLARSMAQARTMLLSAPKQAPKLIEGEEDEDGPRPKAIFTPNLIQDISKVDAV